MADCRASRASSLPSLSAVLARGDVWCGDVLPTLPAGSIPTGYPELDAELPGGGWPMGNLTEILVDRSGLGELSLLMPALARLSADGGKLVLVAPPYLPHAPGWAVAGIAPEHLLVVHPGRQLAWCIEQLLKCGGFAGLLAWPGSIDAKQLRRLQVAAEGRAIFSALWRSTAVAATPSPAALRLMLSADGDTLLLRILKRRGRPASRPLRLSIPRPVKQHEVVVGPAFPPVAAGSPVVAAAA